MGHEETAASILVADEQPATLTLLESIFQKEGYRVLTASSGPQALEIARTEVPDLILLDLAMPDMDGLEICRTLKSDRRTQEIVVFIMSVTNDPEVKSMGFKAGALDFIQKPYRNKELLARVNTQLELKRKLDVLHREYRDLSTKLEESLTVGGELIDQGCVQEEEKSLVFGNEISRIQGIVNQLLIGIGSRLDRKMRNDLALGLHEMVLNAIEHGNLGITSEEKSEALENNTYDDLLKSRVSDPVLSRRKLTVKYRFDGNRVIYRIQDEGNGFDWRSFLMKSEPEDPLAWNGRGILISRYIFNSITYNERGNEVTLEKRIQPIESSNLAKVPAQGHA